MSACLTGWHAEPLAGWLTAALAGRAAGWLASWFLAAYVIMLLLFPPPCCVHVCLNRLLVACLPAPPHLYPLLAGVFAAQYSSEGFRQGKGANM